MARPDLRVSVLGGSSVATVQFADAIRRWPGGASRRPRLELVLNGRNAAKLKTVSARCATTLIGADVDVACDTDLTRSISGSDVILVQVRIGGLAARAFDESFPWAAELPGEETLGPGGIANALRTVRALTPIWEAIRNSAPDALVMILTNPAGIVRSAAADAGLKAVEVCDAPLSLLDAIARRRGTTRSAEVHHYIGMNHVGWWVPESDGLAELSDLTAVAADVVLAHGALPLSYVRYYLDQDEIYRSQVGRPTRASQLMALERQALDALDSGNAPDRAARPAPWYDLGVVPLLDAWWHDSAEAILAGTANEGRLPGIDDRVTIEAPLQVVDRTFVPLPAVAPPMLPMSLLRSNAMYEQLVLDAARTGDDISRFRAILANPMVTSTEKARRVHRAIATAGPGLSG